MANDDLKKVKELLEIVNNKVGKIDTRQSLQAIQLSLMKDQQSVINEKLDGISSDVGELKKDMKELKEDVGAARGDIETLRMDVTWIKEKEGMGHSRNKREIDEIKTHLGLSLMPDRP